MNNKTKTYLLLLVVLGIWGTIAYKIMGGVGSDDDVLATQKFDDNFTPKQITEVESFSIQSINRDPFLGTLATKNKPKTKPKTQKIAKPKKAFPLVFYNAFVQKKKTADSRFAITINNKQYLLKQGQIVDSVKLVSGTDKAILVRYNTQSKTIKRQ